jgi:putative heme utilization carrier protein HutX
VNDNQSMPGSESEALLRTVAGWGNTTSVIVHGGCVFEFKGPFPPGTVAEGYYNLEGGSPGFHGHLNLARIERVVFQTRPHRGRESYAFVFLDNKGDVIFKIFLGRDDSGELVPSQVDAFQRIRQHCTVQ